MSSKTRSIYVFVFLGLSLASIFIGANDINLSQILKGDALTWMILIEGRIPRYLSVVMTGISLSIAGLIMQRISQNRFVSPSTAVTMDGARFGIIISLVAFGSLSIQSRMFFAWLFSMVFTVLFMILIHKLKFKNVIFIPLLGMMLGMIVDSITTFIALKYDLMQTLSGYMMGSFTFILKGRYELLFTSIPLVLIALFYIKRFAIVSMGEDFAKSVGVHYGRTLILGVLVVSMLSASVVTTIGTIPFVGLIVPNMVSYLYGDSDRYVILDTALMGSILLLLSDLISRLVIYPYEVPIGLTLGVIGSLFFVVILIRGYHEKA
ncbi:iron chelate uptake ABC transporter family permease subunit [Erysipelothrix inopinata]|uniref:Iron chelate uptake ABC transporter family permease subunit n=1 Tax=Erysipelothrix inopinata TaxID=225084 RepID=A0A7G9RX01_9FIRM|nr:iron chelate uptake ABC transporter family permease subunit [Erysipelothrix inopinata]QNN60126.1 iron chelate uptake ABC transporter family permease subunit [Erysipelothrix inopinata]